MVAGPLRNKLPSSSDAPDIRQLAREARAVHERRQRGSGGDEGEIDMMAVLQPWTTCSGGGWRRSDVIAIQTCIVQVSESGTSDCQPTYRLRHLSGLLGR